MKAKGLHRRKYKRVQKEGKETKLHTMEGEQINKSEKEGKEM